jgi:hypothetical protein
MSPKDTPRGISIAARLGSTANGPRNLSMSFIEWKDDCESSKSNKASKTGSIWVWTMTLFVKDKKQDSPIATFPLVVGLKSDSHDKVERIIGRDMEKMAKTRMKAFLGRTKTRPLPEEVTFSAELFLSLGDQPERRSGNKLMAGNSRSHGRWRIAADHSKLIGVLPACGRCLWVMRAADSQKTSNEGSNWMEECRECSSCTNWMLGGLDSPLLSYSPTQTFPKGQLLGGETTTFNQGLHKRVNPVEITYEGLKL